jgi:cytochrome c-type biogenesis protein CcmH/NrfG
MGKKPKSEKKEMPKPETGNAKMVRIETAAIIALITLVVGFFGGEIVRLTKQPMQATDPVPGPAAGMPAMPSGMPPEGTRSAGPTREQMNKILELEKEVAVQPNNVGAWTELGHYYFDTDQSEKAIGAYNRSLELNPKNADVWTDLGVMYRRTGKPLEAIAAFDKAIEIDPRHEISQFNKGVVLMGDLDNVEGAINAWEQLLKVNPEAKSPGGESMKAMIEKVRGMKKTETDRQ